MDRLTAFLTSHHTIGVDSPVFIYHLEDVPPYADTTDVVFDYLLRGAYAGVTSVVTLMEITLQPLSVGRDDAATEYRNVITRIPNLEVVAVNESSAFVAARLRATHRVRPADALQLGSCIANGATGFITNDRRLRQVRELEVLVLDDVLPGGAA